jgi:drug/metabolite transporter (DMT)-like permease
MSSIPSILAAVGLVVCGQLLLKAGMQRVGMVGAQRARSPLALMRDVAATPQVVAGLCLYGASAVLWVYVLSRADLSFAYPFLSLAYALVTAAATVIFKERFTARQWLGLGFVVAGVMLVAMTG